MNVRDSDAVIRPGDVDPSKMVVENGHSEEADRVGDTVTDGVTMGADTEVETAVVASVSEGSSDGLISLAAVVLPKTLVPDEVEEKPTVLLKPEDAASEAEDIDAAGIIVADGASTEVGKEEPTDADDAASNDEIAKVPVPLV